MNPEAHFDCLLISFELRVSFGGVTRLELQRIAFLSCLLSIYTKQAVADWGYKFANTGTGLPFSDHLIAATDYLVATGLISDTEGRLRPTESGLQMLGYLRALQSMAPRIPCVSAAAASLLTVPGSIMAEGLQQEPTIVASKLRDSPTMLLDEPHLQTLHQHFSVLAAVIPPGQKDLLSPSVLWLTYMAHVNESNEEGGEDLSGPGYPGGPNGPALSGGPSSSAGPDGEVTVGDNVLTKSEHISGQSEASLAASPDTGLHVTSAWSPCSLHDAPCEPERATEAQPS